MLGESDSGLSSSDEPTTSPPSEALVSEEAVLIKQTVQLVDTNLENPEIRKLIRSLLVEYYLNLQPVLGIATVRNEGIRPEGLTNEIYAAFHHLARGLCEVGANTEKEIRSAEKSHLRRAILDSYKVAINSYITEESKIYNLIDFISLAEDFDRYFPEAFNVLENLRNSRALVRKYYEEAKRAEVSGNFDLTIEKFNQALSECLHLEKFNNQIMRTNAWHLVSVNTAVKQKEGKKNRNNAIIAAVVSAFLTAILTAIATYFITKPANMKDVTTDTTSTRADEVMGDPKVTQDNTKTRSKEK